MYKLFLAFFAGGAVALPISAAVDDGVARVRCSINQPDVVGGWASDHVLVRCRPGFVPRLPHPAHDGDDPPIEARGGSPDPINQTRFDELLDRWNVHRIARTVEPEHAALAAQLGLDRYYTMWVEPGSDVHSLVRELSHLDQLFEVAEIDSLGGLLDVPNANDPFLSQQYYLRNTGQVIEGARGTPGADTRCIDAWALSTGSGDVVLAILDTGVSQSHPDLAGKLLPGRNFTVPIPNGNSDDSWFISHGTACAGVAAASSNNGVGIAGISWGSMILPVKVANLYGLSSEIECGSGLIWAADHGAKVASMSLGFTQGSTFFAITVMYADALDVVMCASSGNTPGQQVFFPARFPEVIAVTATNNRDELATFSTTGPEIFLCAPGIDIITTWDTSGAANTYSYETGTSLSCPIVAGIACLIRAADPRLRADQVRHVLQLGADDLGDAGRDELYGWGRVNALRSLELVTDRNQHCAADWNRDGTITSQDAFDFLSSYIDGKADMNGDGITNSDDFFLFLNRFFEGC